MKVASISKAISIILLIGLTASCRGRGSASQQKSETIVADPAWFTGADKPIRVCFDYSNAVNAQFPKGDAKLQLGTRIIYGYMSWMAYLHNKALQPTLDLATARKIKNLQPFSDNKVTVLWDVPKTFKQGLGDPTQLCAQPQSSKPTVGDVDQAFPVALAFVDHCEDAELEVHFGTKPSFPISESNEPASVVGAAIVRPSDASSGKGGGAIVLPDEGTQMKYADLIEPTLTLVHEFGHVFGTPHVAGTIMDPDYLKLFFADAVATRNVDRVFRSTLFGNTAWSIDQWRQMVLCKTTPENPTFGNGINLGTSFGAFQSFAAPSTSIGLGGYYFYPFGTNDYVFSIPPEAIKSGHVEVETDTKIAEVFHRRPELNVAPIYHQSLVMNQWLGKKYLLKVQMNANDDTGSNVEVTKECPTSNLMIYEGYNRYRTNLPRVLRPAAIDHYAENQIYAFAKCLDNDKSFVEFDAAEFAKKINMASAEKVFASARKAAWNLTALSETRSYILPKKHQWCGDYRGDTLCVWREGALASFEISTAKGYFQNVLTPYVKKYLNADAGFKEVWVGGLHYQTDIFNQGEGYPMRIGFKNDPATDPDVLNYELDIDLIYGMYFPMATGTLERVR